MLACLCGLYGVPGCGSEKVKEPKAEPGSNEKLGKGSEGLPAQISLAEATRLAAKGDRRAIEPLLRAVANADIVADRLVAVLHLGKLKASSAVPVLVGELKRLSGFKNPDDTYRLYGRKILQALEGITGIRHDPEHDLTESLGRWTQWYEDRRSG
jgi:hypothetical protein